MRKLSQKWPVIIMMANLFCVLGILCRRLTNPKTFDFGGFVMLVFGFAFWTGGVWAVYGLMCVIARKLECPSCGSEQVAKYLYGFHKITGAIERDVEAGRIMLGGVSDKENPPKWYCNDCQHEW